MKFHHIIKPHEHCGKFGRVWQLAANGEIKLSLRATGNVDVAAIASRYGGSGHSNAAGLRMPAADFLAETQGK